MKDERYFFTGTSGDSREGASGAKLGVLSEWSPPGRPRAGAVKVASAGCCCLVGSSLDSEATASLWIRASALASC